MKIAYFSRTGNIKRFVRKLDYDVVEAKSSLVIDEPYILIMYTTGIGEVPRAIEAFFTNEINQQNVHGFVCSGNKNWGINYCKAAHILSERFNVPVLQKFELSGNIHDLARFNNIYEEMTNEYRIQLFRI